MGYEEYFPIAEKYKVPIVVTGFEPLDILDGILMTVSQLEEGRHEVENQYARATRREGNRPAQERIIEVFEVVNRQWRGLGEIPASGFQLRGRFQKYDANRRFPFSGVSGARVAGVHQRADSARAQEAARVSGVCGEVHAGKSAGRADGIVGRRVRGLLSLWQTHTMTS